ncbi:Mus7/MMS22 family-domain-containing protein [Phlebopus sp. FC_14]|nr:Mus7/MMS22 family-domain-containing protein [Phlebopus sp. FC_14]
MDIDEIVDTSDAEEREAFDVSEADYWGLSSQQRLNCNDHLRGTDLNDLQLDQGLHLLQKNYGIDCGQEHGASPRKRIKTFHRDGGQHSHNGLSPILASHPVFAASSSTKNFPVNAQSGPDQSRVSDLIHDEEQGSLPQARVRMEGTGNCYFDLSSPPERPGCSRNRVDLDVAGLWGNFDPQSRSQNLTSSFTSRSRSPSTDPWSLFSSPLRASTAPATSSQRSPGPSSPKPDTFQTKFQAKNALSPLTPTSSPLHPSRSRSQSPDELQIISPVESPRKPKCIANSSVEDEHPVIPADTEVPFNRYTLRRREARQLNPYAYDKLLYKQQMQSNPDAIVKFVSPKRRPGTQPAGEQDEGTQAEYSFHLDDTREEDDYVETAGRRKGRVTNVDADERREGSADKDTGWLPGALRALSSSDDEGDEIRQLARKARRAREKEEARSRAEAKKTDVEARTARKRLRSFPVSGLSRPINPSRVPASSASRVVSPAFVRSRSEPRSHSRPASPSQNATSRLDKQPHRASSYSPIRDSDRRQTAEFNYDYQQEEDIYQPGYDTSFLQPVLLKDLEPSHRSSASTRNSSVDPPNIVLADDESSGSESEPDMTAKDRKRFRVLRRMMPAAMISRQLVTPLPPSSTRARRVRSPVSSDSEAKNVPLVPGHARMRISAAYRDIEIRGDPESSDVEQQDHFGDVGAQSMPPDDNSTVRVTRRRHTSSAEYINDTISLSDDSSTSSVTETQGNDSDNDHHEYGTWTLPPPAQEPAREKSLIDWMLTRNRDASGRKRQKFRSRRMSRQSRAPGKPRLDIVAGGVKRYGYHRQTLLPFGKIAEAPVSEAHRGRGRDAVLPREDLVAMKQRKRRRGTVQGSLYNVRHDATWITSKHRESRSKPVRGGLVIEQDDSDFHQALDPGWKAEIDRWKKPILTRQSGADKSNRYHYHSPSKLSGSRQPTVVQASLCAPSTRYISPDMNITSFPSGVKFGPLTYLGKGLLHQLISIISCLSEVTPPSPCHSRGFEIGPTTSPAVFIALFGPLCDRLVDSLRDLDARDADKDKDWEGILRAFSQLVSWLSVRSDDEEFSALDTAIKDYSDGLSSYLDNVQPTLFSLTVHWFMVELSARLTFGSKHRGEFPQLEHLSKASERLMRHMLGIDLQSAFDAIHDAQNDIETTSLSCRAAELWICLIHLLHIYGDLSDVSQHSSGHLFWRVLAEIFPETSPTGAEASEEIWRTIFSLCALSQFTLHGLSTSSFRLPAAWQLVVTALKKIALTAILDKERQLAYRALNKRDVYLSCVVNRCFLLWSQWNWRLDGAMVMFKTLQEIFRSRNFVNLRNENSVFMGFLEKSDLQLLSKRDTTDIVFEIFLKMVVQAVQLLNNTDMDPRQRASHIKKLLQMAVPVSPLPFSKTVPPSSHELSMLLNRFSAMAVAIHLDPTLPNVRFRVSQARRCVDFALADRNSRMACIYGMMYFATIMRHHQIPLEETLNWLAEMADILMDEYSEAEGLQKGKTELDNVAKQNSMTLVQLLLGSVRRIIETQSLDKESTRTEYPDPALLDGAWVTRVFKASTNLVTMSQTGLEIRMLVQSFLDARSKALPQVQLPSVTFSNNESQESQDEYEKVFLDLNDAELLAALGDEPPNTDNQVKEQALCKVLDKSITPAIYRLVCKFMGDNEFAKTRENDHEVADKWIDCWVGCANVLVQNGSKEWSLYMKLGPQSWEKIIDASWRRRVGLRFNLTLLRLDPRAYPTYKNDFVGVFLVSTLSQKTTIEHEFASLLFTLDGLQHPLLRGAPFAPLPGSRKFDISRDEYERARLPLIDVVFSNIAGCLRLRLDAESQSYAGFLVSVLSAMRDIYEVFVLLPNSLYIC